MLNIKTVTTRTKFQRVLLHILFWIVFTLFMSLVFSYQSRFPFYFFLEYYIVSLIPFVLFTYFVVYFLVPRFLQKGMIIWFITLIIPVSIVFAAIKLTANKFVFHRYFVPDIFHPEIWFDFKLLFQQLLWLWIPTLIFASIKYFKDLIITRNEKNEIENKHLQTELQLLKAQLQPHFLFNTLNNLYVLALEKSEKTPDVVLKISELFHFILYECDAKQVSVEKELRLIRNYIELEKLRYDENLKITIKEQDNLNTYHIAPMIYFVLVENAFKHGVRNDTSSPSISIDLRIENNTLQFKIINSKPNLDLLQPNNTKGVGLDNLRKRLTLIYPGAHQLLINNNNKEFEAILNLKLNAD